MRALIFGKRTAKELLRDPLSLLFGLGFPVALLVLMSMIQRSIPVDLFLPEQLAPGIAVFGLSFFCLFTALLVARDRASSLIARLRAAPMTAWDFLLGYLAPMVPMALAQLAAAYLAALPLGLRATPRIFLAIAVQLPLAVFHIAAGMICGCCLRERQVGGLCGALATNLSAWLSGAWFDVSLVGGVFAKLAEALPFYQATMCGRQALSSGSVDGRRFAILCAYALLTLAAAVVIAKHRLERTA